MRHGFAELGRATQQDTIYFLPDTGYQIPDATYHILIANTIYVERPRRDSGVGTAIAVWYSLYSMNCSTYLMCIICVYLDV